MFNTCLERVTNNTSHRKILGFRYKFFVHAFVHISSRSSCTTLPLKGMKPTQVNHLGTKTLVTVLSFQFQPHGDELIEQTWLKNRAKWANSTALSMSASSHTMKGDFPPSSSVTGFRLLLAASSRTILPVPVDPVKATCK